MSWNVIRVFPCVPLCHPHLCAANSCTQVLTRLHPRSTPPLLHQVTLAPPAPLLTLRRSSANPPNPSMLTSHYRTNVSSAIGFKLLDFTILKPTRRFQNFKILKFETKLRAFFSINAALRSNFLQARHQGKLMFKTLFSNILLASLP